MKGSGIRTTQGVLDGLSSTRERVLSGLKNPFALLLSIIASGTGLIRELLGSRLGVTCNMMSILRQVSKGSAEHTRLKRAGNLVSSRGGLLGRLVESRLLRVGSGLLLDLVSNSLAAAN